MIVIFVHYTRLDDLCWTLASLGIAAGISPVGRWHFAVMIPVRR